MKEELLGSGEEGAAKATALIRNLLPSQSFEVLSLARIFTQAHDLIHPGHSHGWQVWPELIDEQRSRFLSPWLEITDARDVGKKSVWMLQYYCKVDKTTRSSEENLGAFIASYKAGELKPKLKSYPFHED